MEQEAKQVPYGVADFERVMTQNMYYVDKTMYLPMLEKLPSYLFFMAYLNLNDYYITAPVLELSHGYCDFFLLSDLTHYPTKHSYILELKVLQKNDSEAKAAQQWKEAVEQIRHYAEAPRVETLRQGTTLHKIIMQFREWELERMEEV